VFYTDSHTEIKDGTVFVFVNPNTGANSVIEHCDIARSPNWWYCTV